ncbi:ERF family protein [Streptomyces sp. NBC_01565]|uniref:ERF family protein n=1 Tax=Streptomyces sp. NBC_01565 TaxID=2975881 RepID=UPI002254729C|nr:ERF family protein [Streptomyces sp. NBC_01565]MCX4540462.1 ERF family protein [Streptomyces sp. NBC_01565]
MGLRENAAAAAGREVTEQDHTTVRETSNLAEPDLGDLSQDAEPTTSAITAWSRVMGEVRSIGKNEKFDGGRAGKFSFRGIETALNAFGPACRKHGVLVIQHKVETEYRDISTSSGGRMRECTALVTFRIFGPDGSYFDSQAAGEASDSGGRSTPKAQSIALRTLLINNGLVPTQDRDADAEHFERAEPIGPTAEEYRDEQLDPKTSPSRLNQIRNELRTRSMLNSKVTNEVGELESLDSIGGRMYQERTGGAQ